MSCPPLSIPAEEPVSITPEAVSRAGAFPVMLVSGCGRVFPPFPLLAAGVFHPASVESCTRLLPVMFSVMVPPLEPSVAEGVVHPARFACRGSWSSRLLPSSRSAAMPGVSFQSRADGVTHPAKLAAPGRRSVP
ncbi:MAG: hypothetical protein LBQ51_10625 [Desulfovibrio sp.]|nr:hypothetical protein [Desulfovibrio sp.]